MDRVLEDHVAVITGGASGIGRASVLRFLDAGARVVFGDLNADNGERLVDEVTDRERVRFVRADVSDEGEVAGLIGTAVETFGRLDVVFNNAGIGGAFGPLTDIDVADWDRTFAVVSRGVFLGTKHGARAMIELGRGGSIVNTASVAGLTGGAGPLAYSAAKASVVSLTNNAAVELAAHRIRVNAICPGMIHTPLVIRDEDDEAMARERLPTFQPWPEMGRPEDIAGLALYLAGPESAFLTGEAVRADGGLLAWGPRLVRPGDPQREAARHTGFSEGSTGRPGTKRPADQQP